MAEHSGASLIVISALPEEYVKDTLNGIDFKRFRSVRFFDKMQLIAVARNKSGELFSYTGEDD
jgi:hypothetical protein